MPFVYRLEKILNYRIQKKDEQLEVVKKAEAEVRRIQAEIDKNKNTISVLKKSMFTSPHTMMENYDTYIKHLYEVIEGLEEDKRLALERLREEREKLAELEKGVKVLEKHKEKNYENYLEEEKQAEMKVLDEIAGQKYFGKMQDRKIEELIEEGLDINEY